MKTLQVINWNIKFTGYRKKKFEFLFSLTKEDYCIILQEVTPDIFSQIEKEYGATHSLAYSLDYRKPGMFDSSARELGVLILCSKNISIQESGVVERNVFPDRTIWATIEWEGRELKVLGLHSITGCGYHRAKSAQYDTFAEFIEDYRPDIIGIDANEPKEDGLDVEQMMFYNNGNGARCFFRGVKRIGLVDAYIEGNAITEYVQGEYLTPSCYVRRKGAVRYDFLFVRKNFKVLTCKYLYEEALEVESDHALIVAELSI